MNVLFLYFFATVGLSFFCSFVEAVILTVTPTYVALLIKNKHRSGHLLKGIKDNIDRSLSAILTINAMAQIMGSASVGAEAQKLFGDDMLAVVSMVLTFLILFLAEILPKTLGVAHWKRAIVPCAYIVKVMIIVTYPLVWFFEKVARLLTRNSGFGARISRDEMIVVAELGQNEGALVEKETRVIRNLLRLNNIYVKDVMTPKEEVFSFHKDQTVEDAMDKHGNELYSRVPVYDKDPQDIVGVVLRFNIFNAYSEDHKEQTMEILMKPVYKVRSSQSLSKILDEFITRREHLFLVIDENEKMVGLITLEDVIETLLGVEIEDEIDNVEEMRERTLQQWRERVKSRLPHKRVS